MKNLRVVKGIGVAKPRKKVKPAKPKALRKSRVNSVNAKRKAEEFARCYHSVERVEFVKALPCVVTLKSPSENAHIKSGGMGRKAGYRFIVPMSAEKHHELHDIGIATFLRKYPWVNLEESAARTEAAWLEHQSQHQLKRTA